MSEEKTLVVSSRVPAMSTWQMIQSIAPVAVASRMYKLKDEQAMMIMLKGHELGLGLAASIDFIHVIEDKPSLSPQGALALIHDSNLLAGLKIEDIVDDEGNPWACQVWMKRKSGIEYTAIYTMDDARRARLTEGSPTARGKRGYGNWEKYPANMLRWRSVGYCADIVFPDVGGGLKRPEELGAIVDIQGEPIEVEAVVVSQPQLVAAPTLMPAPSVVSQPPQPIIQQPAPAAPTPEPEQSLMQKILTLSEQYSAHAVMIAGNNQLPSTLEEYIKVKEILEAAETESENSD